MKVTKLEDLEIYQESLSLARDMYCFVTVEQLKKDFALRDQIQRAALSVSANIAEGYGRKSKNDFAHFLAISLGSINEVVAFLDFLKLTFDLDIKVYRERFQNLARRIYTFYKYLKQ